MVAKTRNSTIRKIVISLSSILFISGALGGFILYRIVIAPNVSLNNQATTHVFIPTDSTFNFVVNMLDREKIIINRFSFEWVAERMNYRHHIKPGKYLIQNKMSNRELVTLLRSGEQDPVLLTFNNIRNKLQLATKAGNCLEADSTLIIALLNDKYFLRQFNLTPDNSMIIFIPNTYEFIWNTSAKDFFERMLEEYKIFWTDTRRQKAAEIVLTPSEVSILASIVELETSKNDEKSTIAGVYMNRLKTGWKLEADPTVIFALQDFGIRRVLKSHTKFDSPYNTYKFSGLPPGPIGLSSVASIDAVLNYEKHDYMYFCAKEDFSGYHNFSKTYTQHLINARKYQKELRKRANTQKG